MTASQKNSGAYMMLADDVIGFAGWQLPALIALMTAVSITEGLTLALLLPLLTQVGIATSGESVASTAVNAVIDKIIPGAGPGGILAIILAVALLQLILFLTQSWWAAKLVRRYTANWQIMLLAGFLKADWGFLASRKGGELGNSIIAESGRVAGALQIFAHFAATAVATVIYLVIALLFSWQTTLILLGLAFFMALSISSLYRISNEVGRQIGPLNAELQVSVGENLACAKIIKATASEDRMIARVDRVARGLEKAGRMGMFLPSFVRGMLEFMALAALGGFLAFGMQPLNVAPADMVIVMVLFVRLFPRLTTMQSLAHSLNTHVPGILILRSLRDEARQRAERYSDGGDVAFRPTLPAQLNVSGLRVRYGANEVLRGVDLALPLPGMIGIVGGSGAGKSTLVLAILGLVTPTGGTIRLGTHDIGEIRLAAWRSAIGYVPQETMLFHTSVLENLTLAKPEASRAEVMEAARRANAHNFIMALPDGYDTQIGDQGSMLSGGQRQRLGIARALVAQPALLLLDEPTSALDPHSESEVLETLQELKESIGIVIVAHRLPTVRAADCIYVLEDGKVIESGGWSDLIAREDRFHALAKLQHIVT